MSVIRSSVRTTAIRRVVKDWTVDHQTYVAAASDEQDFLDTWDRRGFHEMVRLTTVRFEATHIALRREGQPPAMVGLSISPDPASPINQFVARYGTGIQHSAHLVPLDVDMDQAWIDFEAAGVVMMTRPMHYVAPSGAQLTQMFSMPTAPYGPFSEFVQRRPAPSGEEFNGFSVPTIEDLYQSYQDASRFLEARC
ncbi:MAG: hypothetical protein JWM47_2955 [Acidimicrobiales bacterium]|nr:hypothetical protein [Acidimicrobiales bacterium]